jgi:hypothetical protein
MWVKLFIIPWGINKVQIFRTQVEFVENCLSEYRCNPPQGYHWEEAHYPLPRSDGNGTVRLWYPHHIIQGCLQTLELQKPCIHGSKRHKERKILEKEFPEYLPIFDEAILLLQKYAGERSPGDRNAGKRSAAQKTGCCSEEYRNSPNYLPVRIKSGRAAVENLTGIHSPEYKNGVGLENKRRAFAIANSQKWISLIDGFISNAGGVAKHNRKIGADPNARKKLQ